MLFLQIDIDLVERQMILDPFEAFASRFQLGEVVKPLRLRAHDGCNHRGGIYDALINHGGNPAARATIDMCVAKLCGACANPDEGSMEKNQWKQKTGQKILEAYEEVRPLSEREKEFAALSLAYPGKFKKIAGSYYRSNKAHLSKKNVEKLQICIRQTEEKYEFLSRIFPLNL